MNEGNNFFHSKLKAREKDQIRKVSPAVTPAVLPAFAQYKTRIRLTFILETALL